jgi:hypothetical protein
VNRWLIGAAGALAAGAVIASRRDRAAVEDPLARATSEQGPEVEIRGHRVRLPYSFHRSEAFLGIFAADLGALTAVLPTDELHPVKIDQRRAAVLVGAFHHREITAKAADGRTLVARPYGEVILAAAVTLRPAPPLAPLLAPSMFHMGGFVLHFPVTTRLAMDAGRLWNYPKFVADMDFTEGPDQREVRVSEGGRALLTLQVRPGGRPSIDRSPTVLYSVRDGRILETSLPTMEVHQVRLGATGANLELGSHPIADDLRAMELERRPIASQNVLASQLVMPDGRSLGPARPYAGYTAEERSFGRYTVRRPGTPEVDQYAGLGDEPWIAVTVQPSDARAEGAPGAGPADVPEPVMATAGR